MKALFALVLASMTTLPLVAENPIPFTAGEIRLMTVAGKQQTELRYRLHQGQLRIDRPGEIVPAPPVNLLDLKTGTVRILRPHNGTWMEVPAASLRPARAGSPGLPAHASAPPPGLPVARPKIGADLAEVHAIPDLPRRPELLPPGGLPGWLPPDVGPQATGGHGGLPRASGIPPFPQISGAFPAGFPSPRGMVGPVGPLELKATDEKRVIHGYECTKHTLAIPREGEMSMWLLAAGLFPPFHLLLDDVPRRSHLPDWSVQIPALLRERDQFPLLAVWESQPGHEAGRWEITRITAGEIGDPDSTLFEIPASFYRIEDPPEAAVEFR